MRVVKKHSHKYTNINVWVFVCIPALTDSWTYTFLPLTAAICLSASSSEIMLPILRVSKVYYQGFMWTTAAIGRYFTVFFSTHSSRFFKVSHSIFVLICGRSCFARYSLFVGIFFSWSLPLYPHRAIYLYILALEDFSTSPASHISHAWSYFYICTLPGANKTDLYTQPSVLLTTQMNVSWQSHLLNSDGTDGRTGKDWWMGKRRTDRRRGEGHEEEAGLGTLAGGVSQLSWHVCPSSCPCSADAIARAHKHTLTETHSAGSV